MRYSFEDKQIADRLALVGAFNSCDPARPESWRRCDRRLNFRGASASTAAGSQDTETSAIHQEKIRPDSYRAAYYQIEALSHLHT